MRNVWSFLVPFCILVVGKWTAAQDPAPNVIDALAGLKTQLNTVNSTADLLCESSQMMVNLTFAQPFFGKVFLENAPEDQKCWLFGTGLKSYRYPVPLKECGTRQISLREFENTLQIRFANTPNITLVDERKTILCRYPPPVVPPILPIPPPIAGAIPPVPAASVSELELLLIIAAVLFLGLLLIGLCCAWWCCKRRRAAKIVESEGMLIEAPDVMKLSGTTLPFMDVRIPRVKGSESVSGSDVSESALITRLEGSPEVFPPPLGNEVVPYVRSKGYEEQIAEMKIPESVAAGSEIAEGEHETNETITDREVEHIAIFAPPIPARPPSPPLRLVPSGPGRRDDYERETVSDVTEVETEHTLIAGRVPPRPPSPVLSMISDRRSDESITSRRSVVPVPVPPTRPHLKSVTTEMETETHSVVDSLENEVILRAVPIRQPRLLPPPARPFYPLDTRTETTITEEILERVYSPTAGPTTKEDRRESRRRPEPQPDTTTTTTVNETDIRRDIDVYPGKRPPFVWTQDDRRGHEQFPPQGPGPSTTTTRTTRETDIRRDHEIRPAAQPRPTPSLYKPPPQSTVTTTHTETDIRRDYEIVPPTQIIRPPPPTTTTSTRTETDIQREYEIVRPPGVRPPYQPSTTTTTRTETDVHRDYEVLRPPLKFPKSPVTTTTSRTETDVRRDYEIARPPRTAPSTTTILSETDDRRHHETIRPLTSGPKTVTRFTRETDVQREYDTYPSSRYPPGQPYTVTSDTRFGDDDRNPDRPFSPEFVDTVTRTSTERNIQRDFGVYPPGTTRYEPPSRTYGPVEPGTSTSTRVHRETTIRRDYDYRGQTPRRDGSISPDYPDTSDRTSYYEQYRDHSPDYPVDEPSRFVNTITRDIQKQIDAGTPPDSSGPPSETSPDGGPRSPRTTAATSNVTRTYSTHAPSLIPRPVLREPWQDTTTTTTRTSSTTRLQSGFAEAVPTYRPFNPSYPVVDVSLPRQSRRPPVNWEEVYEVIYDDAQHTQRYSGPSYRDLPQDDIERLRDLVMYDSDFQRCITRVQAVYDLYYIRYTPPYDTYFVETTWTVVIRIFVVVLHLPHPHPDDPDFIEPQPEWFAEPMNLGSLDRSDSSSSSTTLTNNSFAERALSEVTEAVPRMTSGPRSTTSNRTETSESGSSEFGSVVRRGSTDYSASEQSVHEYFQYTSPGPGQERSYRGQRITRRRDQGNDRDDPMSEL